MKRQTTAAYYLITKQLIILIAFKSERLHTVIDREHTEKSENFSLNTFGIGRNSRAILLARRCLPPSFLLFYYIFRLKHSNVCLPRGSLLNSLRFISTPIVSICYKLGTFFPSSSLICLMATISHHLPNDHSRSVLSVALRQIAFQH